MPFDDEKDKKIAGDPFQDSRPSQKILSMLSDDEGSQAPPPRRNQAESAERIVLGSESSYKEELLESTKHVGKKIDNLVEDNLGKLSAFFGKHKKAESTEQPPAQPKQEQRVQQAIESIGKDIVPASQRILASQKQQKQKEHFDQSFPIVTQEVEEAPVVVSEQHFAAPEQSAEQPAALPKEQPADPAAALPKDETPAEIAAENKAEPKAPLFGRKSVIEKPALSAESEPNQKKSIIDSIPLFGGWSKKMKKGKAAAAIAAGLAVIMLVSGIGYAAVTKLPTIVFNDAGSSQSSEGDASTQSGEAKAAAKKPSNRDPVYGLYLDGKLVQASQSEEELGKSTLEIMKPYRELEASGKVTDLTLANEPIIKQIEGAKWNTNDDTGEITVSVGEETIPVATDVESLKKALFYGDEPQTYVVKPGDTVSEIAEAHGIDMATLMVANPSLLETTVVQEGQELQVSQLSGDLKLSFSRQVVSKEEVTFHTERKETKDVLQGETKIQTEGKMGVASVTTRYTYTGGEIVDREQLNVAIEQEPVDRVILIGTGTAPKPSANTGNSGGGSKSPAAGSGQFIWPCRGTVTSEFGPRWGRNHNGIDIGNATGTPIWASASGKVVVAGWEGGYGKSVVIDHGNGLRTRYGHNSEITVSVGQQVTQGQQIAKLGNTGNSTGPHCHFEILVNGAAVNPRKYL